MPKKQRTSLGCSRVILVNALGQLLVNEDYTTKARPRTDWKFGLGYRVFGVLVASSASTVGGRFRLWWRLIVSGITALLVRLPCCARTTLRQRLAVVNLHPPDLRAQPVNIARQLSRRRLVLRV